MNSANHPLISDTFLQELCENDIEKFKLFYQVFVQELPKRIEELQQAINKQSCTDAGHTAHALKSLCGYMGIDATAIGLVQIVQLGRSHKWSESFALLIQQCIDDIKSCNQSLQALAQ
jgi:HPt (histidine-containing phosphotransfer) domain-containing protein